MAGRPPLVSPLVSPPPQWVLLALPVLLALLAPARLAADCTIEENSQIFISICNVRSVFPEIDSPKVDNFQNLFRIVNDQLELLQSLDRESLIQNEKCDSSKLYSYNSHGQCTLILELSGAGPKFYQLPILVADVNDNVPSFDRLTFNLKIAENSPPHKEVELPLARDLDRGNNGTVVYELKRDAVSNKFVLITPSASQGQDSSLKLKILHSFDREKDEEFQLVLTARDLGTPSLSSSLIIKIEITDVNDHAPHFNQSTYRFKSPESIVQGQPIGQVFATDKDMTSRVTIMISPSASSQIMDKFSVASDGVISTKVALVYVSSTFDYRIPIVAVDSGVPTLTATTTAFVHVTDINDNRPFIEVASSQPNNRLVLTENCPANTYIAKITVSDKDHGLNGEVECRLDSSYLFNLESIQSFENRRHYKLVTAPGSSFDREQKDQHQLSIVCSDLGVPALTTTRPTTIMVRDENDNPPVFPRRHIATSVAENLPAGTKVLLLKAIDRDLGVNAQTKYRLAREFRAHFAIDQYSGRVTTLHPFDRERQADFKIRATAYDNLAAQMHSNITIHIAILDENDNPPRFLRQFEFRIKENREGVLGRVEAVDRDVGQNARVEYFLIVPSSIFEISKNGEILVSQKIHLDRERTDNYSLEIGARDHGLKSLTSSTTVRIIIDDINDNPPVFLDPKPGSQLNVSVDTRPGARIYTVKAVDRDSGDNARLLYSVHPQSVFFINSSDGGIYLNRSLADERFLPEKLIIYARDGGPAPQQTMTSLHLNYVRNDKYKQAVPGKKQEPKPSFPRDLVLSLGIGLVLLIFTCLLMLVTYFCASMIVQRRRQHRRMADKDEAASLMRSNWLYLYCCCESAGFSKPRDPSKGANIPFGSTNYRQSTLPVCHNRWDKSKEAGIEEDPVYSYREFTMKPLVPASQNPAQYDRLMSVPRAAANPYWQYNTIPNPAMMFRPAYAPDECPLSEVVYHQGNAYLYKPGRPDLGDSNSSDEVNRIIYGELGPTTLQTSFNSSTLLAQSAAGYENEKLKCQTGPKCGGSAEALQTSKESVCPNSGGSARYAGYVVGSPCFANSFV